ncbi:NYN domain-containing protein [Hamadaea tsunoensis]|uniref:NYN domain-containing protein n=1 Tax=Hamadaea tsunoensis TaxID=53368 RepID=UPI000423286C|nr:NYN domain-containing protein [Hamadaea tsunoensis]
MVTAYIDGFNLYYGMKSAYRRKYMWLDVVELVRQLRPHDQVQVVRYFTAIVKEEPAAAANQTTYLDALRTHNGALVDVRVGRFRNKTIGRCKVCRKDFLCTCPTTYQTYEEKETDVALGVAMVEDAALGVGDVSLLISADSDMLPAVRSLQRIAPNRPVYVALPPSNQPRFRSIQGAGVFYIRESALSKAQLPPAINDATGRKYARPVKWS